MFTIEQIQVAHARVKSGADFPDYIREIANLGVVRYETFVGDNHTAYYSTAGKEAESSRSSDSLAIAPTANASEFKKRLKRHQHGETNYPTFRTDCAANGVEKWIVDLAAMTCTYFDSAGNEVLLEAIPA